LLWVVFRSFLFRHAVLHSMKAVAGVTSGHGA
jgi:hypothetical protein